MQSALLFVYIIMVALGLYFHKAYENKPFNGNKYINLGQFYIDIFIPFIFGSFAFVIILETLRKPELPLFVPDTVLLFALAASASLCFLGSGMHVIAKLSSKLIEESHKAYRLNRFYHIYAAHIASYGGFMFFMMSLSILSLKHPDGRIATNMIIVHILAGILLGYFVTKVTCKPREMIRVFWPVKTVLILSYLMIVYPYSNMMLDSPMSLFLTSVFTTTFFLYLKTLLPILFTKLKNRRRVDFGF